ncbi:hypothetical protein N7466_009993 [Penicillium verhagenii]|uniref:uncharacterized protein n=1 Tax=Penicillium verhagenii TaxID=1562060 RepID=UPI002545318D|nr:uncharacterized protein N7466_009993 [Penicillium verhagenii]KAJ5919050.1 hypothetical protein N7466_009993 [Penicillium verhagenii]
MSEMLRKAEDLIYGHQHETNDTDQTRHNSSPPPGTVSRGVQTSGTIMTEGPTGVYTSDVASQIDDQITGDSDDEDHDAKKSIDSKPARPTKQDTLVGC